MHVIYAKRDCGDFVLLKKILDYHRPLIQIGLRKLVGAGEGKFWKNLWT
jgi:hypothetical protein